MSESLPARAAALLGLRPKDPLVPPRRLRGDDGDFAALGEEELSILVSLGKLRPDERVLELGSGAGRLARALSDYLGPGGTYDGLEASARAVDWCAHAYRDRPDFAFAALGDGPLPFPDESFDLVVSLRALGDPALAPQALAERLREGRRLLAPEGRLFATLHLLDDEARAALADGRAARGFGQADGVRALDGDAAAYEEEWLLDRVADAGFRRAGIRHGTWSGREGGRAAEDILVARR